MSTNSHFVEVLAIKLGDLLPNVPVVVTQLPDMGKDEVGAVVTSVPDSDRPFSLFCRTTLHNGPNHATHEAVAAAYQLSKTIEERVAA
jgi:hypothetical protein